jgi:ATP-dependent helicase HepA
VPQHKDDVFCGVKPSDGRELSPQRPSAEGNARSLRSPVTPPGGSLSRRDASRRTICQDSLITRALTSVADKLVAKNLVRWKQPGGESLGTVVRCGDGGRHVVVRLDNGSEHTFAWPSEVLERVMLPTGQHVRILSSGVIGVISATRSHNGIALYQISLPGGQAPTVMEDGVRPAVITDPIERLRTGDLQSTRSTNLRVAATRLLFAYQHDELSTLGNSRVEIKPHQVGVVHRVAESYPHRFILADEVGLGKTIEAGLLIRELQARGVANRILVLAPSGLVNQWQQELKTKFNLSFSLYNSNSIGWLRNDHPSENPWTVRDLVLTSTTYAAWDEDRRREIVNAGWDMVIIDEAHHARRTYQGANKTTSTNLYRLAEQISDPDIARAQAMLLLTATPMQLHPFELYSLIELLDPALFPTFEDFDHHRTKLRGLNTTVECLKRFESITMEEREATLADAERWLGYGRPEIEARARERREELIDDLKAQHRLSDVMVRNRKRIIGGFQPRVAAVWEVELSEREREAYWAMTDYLRTGYARSRSDQNNALGFLMTTFQKLNASSSYALKRSLMRRIEKLEAVTIAGRHQDIIDDAELEELPTAKVLDDLLSQRLDADWQEVRELERIVELLDEIELDSKATMLLENLAQIATDDPDAKVIVFTQFRDTQDYLRDHVGAPWTVNLFHGQLKPHEKDGAVARFRDGHGPQLLISTEAGGEGRNFQFCHILVNYDLPWNPMKVEQRIGRVDRIGQQRPVKIFNLSTRETIEERVVDVLTSRIGVFKETIGGLDPILGEVENDLRTIFLLAEEEAHRELESFERRVQARVAEAREAERHLADLIMDTRSYRKEEVESLLQRPRAVSPDHVKRFVLGALSELGVEIERVPEHAGVFHLRLGAKFEHLFPDEVRVERHRQVTFDLSVALEREEVEYLAFGHWMVDGLVEHVRSVDYGGVASTRVVLTDEVEPTSGWFFVYVLELRGLTTTRELHPVFVRNDDTLDPACATWLLDRAMSGRREEFGATPQLPVRDKRFDAAVTLGEGEAVDRLLDRQSATEATNARRLGEERSKRERFYDYRSHAVADKLAANRRILDRIRASAEDADRRILPVWEKNVYSAERMVASVEQERTTRLAELDGRDHVTAQHELLSMSYVIIEPDPQPLLNQIRQALTPPLFQRLQRCCGNFDAGELAARQPALEHRRERLIKLAQQHRFHVRLATSIADALIAALNELDRYAESELALLNGAVGYFLELDDEAHDITDPNGFHDDARVVRSVLEVVGRAELAIEIDAAAAPVANHPPL